MKKILFTIALGSFFTLTSKAQTAEPAKKENDHAKKEHVNADGTTQSHHDKKIQESVPASERAGAHNDHGKAQETKATPNDHASDKGKEKAGKKAKTEPKKEAAGDVNEKK